MFRRMNMFRKPYVISLSLDEYVWSVGSIGQVDPHIILGIYYSGIDLILGGLGGSRGVSDQFEVIFN